MQWVVTLSSGNAEITDRVMRVEASDWLAALRIARRQAGDQGAALGLVCRIQADQSILVHDRDRRRVFSLRPAEPGEIVPAPSAHRPSVTRPSSSPGVSRLATERAYPVHPALAAEASRPPTQDAAVDVDGLLGSAYAHAQDLEAQPSSAEAVGYALDIAVALIPAEAGAVLLYDAEDGRVHFVATRGPKALQIVGLTLALGEGVAGFSVQEGVALNVVDLAQSPHLRTAIDQGRGETRSVASAPIWQGGRVVGALELVNRIGLAGSFTDGELHVLNYLARRLGERLDG